MTRLPESAAAWDTPEFEDVFRRELGSLGTAELPLQQGLTTGDAAGIHARAGIFYSGIIAGCSCADDPTPVDEQSEYCEVQVDIDRKTADTVITLLE
jgi:hypothetical protein